MTTTLTIPSAPPTVPLVTILRQPPPVDHGPVRCDIDPNHRGSTIDGVCFHCAGFDVPAKFATVKR